MRYRSQVERCCGRAALALSDSRDTDTCTSTALPHPLRKPASTHCTPLPPAALTSALVALVPASCLPCLRATLLSDHTDHDIHVYSGGISRKYIPQSRVVTGLLCIHPAAASLPLLCKYILIHVVLHILESIIRHPAIPIAFPATAVEALRTHRSVGPCRLVPCYLHQPFSPTNSTSLFESYFVRRFLSSHHTRTLRGTWPRLARGSQIITVLQPQKTSGRAERGAGRQSAMLNSISISKSRGNAQPRLCRAREKDVG